MLSLVQVVEKEKNEKESVGSEANRMPYNNNNNVECLVTRRNNKALSKARDKVLKAATKLNW
ncbi:hypothetical protein [Serratia bockelmannii]|uniref:hypothetical protein n=1 Tax=Serratia TaxID=613 RepID=UPI001E08302E|nr:hypothetical protein [Serratia marcescens]